MRIYFTTNVFMKLFFHFLLFIVPILLNSCSSKKAGDELIPAQILYDDGILLLNKGEYKAASDKFEQIFFQHTGDDITSKSQLMRAYSLYLAEEYDDVIDLLALFIKLYPRYEHIDYVYYMRALCEYDQISDLGLDQSRTMSAKNAFLEFVLLFPNSKYTNDVVTKIKFVNDRLAANEMLIGRYYLEKRNIIGAIKRFQTILRDYNYTAYVPEALYRLIECSKLLNLEDEAIRYYHILQRDHKENKWTKKSEKYYKK